MTSDRVMVNGTVIDKAFLDDNIREARSYSWSRSAMTAAHDHAHCIICMTAIPNEQSDHFFQSGGLVLCAHCHAKFLSQP